jgi:hypothetical protein
MGVDMDFRMGDTTADRTQKEWEEMMRDYNNPKYPTPGHSYMYDKIKGKFLSGDYRFIDRTINLMVAVNSHSYYSDAIDKATEYVDKRETLRNSKVGFILLVGTFFAGIAMGVFFVKIVFK